MAMADNICCEICRKLIQCFLPDPPPTPDLLPTPEPPPNDPLPTPEPPPNDPDDPDKLIERISNLAEQISKHVDLKNKRKWPSQEHPRPWPSNSEGLKKLEEFLSAGFDIASNLKEIDISQTSKTILNGIGHASVATAGLLVVVYVWERFEAVTTNQTECLNVLKEMSRLAIVIKQFNESPQLNGQMKDQIKHATSLIVKGSEMCGAQIKTSNFAKFCSTSANREDLNKFKDELDKTYRDINTHMGIRILAAVADQNLPPSRKCPDYAVGIEDSMKDVLNLLEFGSKKTAVAVVLYGLGGFGKTTLAQYLFSRIELEGFKYSKVELFKNPSSPANVNQLQKQIYKDLMEKEAPNDFRIDMDGQLELAEVLKKVPAFIFIDNVLGEDELRQLLPQSMHETKKVRLLLTARNKEVSSACNMETKIHLMKGLTCSDGMDLLRQKMISPQKNHQHAEGMDLSHKEKYDETDDKDKQIDTIQLKEIVEMCKGIPKLLQVVAGFISSENNQQNAYRKFKEERKTWSGEIGEKQCYLFSYEHLPDVLKDPFLDVCSFFTGWDWNTVADIVGESELEKLESRALMNRDTNGVVAVHDLILAIGRQKAEETDGERLNYSANQLMEFLDNKDEKDIQRIKGIWLNENSDSLQISAKKLDLMSKSLRILGFGRVRRVEVDGKCNNPFKKLIFFQGAVPDLPFGVSQLDQLRYLSYKPEKDFSLYQMPLNLRYMEFDGQRCSHTIEIHLPGRQRHRDLRTLRLESFTKLKLDGLQGQCLRVLSLKNCSSLEQLPDDFAQSNSLEELDLQGCKSLKALPNSIVKLSSLRKLNLSSCKNLEELPCDLGNLTSLVQLDISRCSNLISIPESIRHLRKLPSIDISFCYRLTKLPDGFCNLSITYLKLTKCKHIEKLPDQFGELERLRSLKLKSCTSLQKLPETSSKLKSLVHLDLSGCSELKELFMEFHCLSLLRILSLADCQNLKELPENFHLLPSLKHLDLSNCEMLEGKWMDNVVKIETLEIVYIAKSGKLQKRWENLRGDKSWSFEVDIGEDLRPEQKENKWKELSSKFDGLLVKGGLSRYPVNTIVLVMFDGQSHFNPDFPWPLIEEVIDDMQENVEMIYIGKHRERLPNKVEDKLMGWACDDESTRLLLEKMFSTLKGDDREVWHKKMNQFSSVPLFSMSTKIVQEDNGAHYLSCWERLKKWKTEKLVLSKCTRYLQLKRVAAEIQKSNIRLLRELFVYGIGREENCFSRKSQKVRVEDLEGKTILLEIRPANACHDIRFQTLAKLYEKEKERLEIISIPIGQASTESEQFSRDIPWLVFQNSGTRTRALEYFLIEGCPWNETEGERSESWYPSRVKKIEPDGRIATYKPILSMLERWGPDVYPFTEERIEESRAKEWHQRKTMSSLEFLFLRLESQLKEVTKAMREKKIICLLCGGKHERTKRVRKKFACSIVTALEDVKERMHFIYVPVYGKVPAALKVTDCISMPYFPLNDPNDPKMPRDMEGLSQWDVMRFWTRVRDLREEINVMDETDKQLDGLLKSVKPGYLSMTLMGEDGEMVTTKGNEIAELLKTNTKGNEAKRLLLTLIKDSKTDRTTHDSWLKLESSLS